MLSINFVGELGNITDDLWTVVKFNASRQQNDFWAPDGDRTSYFQMNGETLLRLSYQD